MSCHDAQTEGSGDALDHDSSDYGSDFTVDEEELLNELLARVVATEQTATGVTAIQDFVTPPPQSPIISAEDLNDLKPLQEPLLVTDIEDYEIPDSVRVPKVLGREAWSPTTNRVWQPSSQRHLSSPVAGIVGPAITVEHPMSTEGRQRDLEKQKAREQGWTTTKEEEEEPKDTSGQPDSAVVFEQPPPLDRFRKPPNKSLSVSDLIAPAWCELQYWYTLTKHGRKRRTPAMKQGSAVHKVLEEEVHTTVPIEVTTKEDGWALRIWNVIQGLRTLREFGMTRELEVWGLVDGELVTGVIDQLSYVCPDRDLEASAATYYADAQSARAALPEYQMSITDYLLSPSRRGKKLDQLRWKDVSESVGEADEDVVGLPQPSLDFPRVYITDIKTRASRSIPTVSSSSFRPTHLQLQLYYHMLNKLVTSDDLTIHTIANRYDLDSDRVFTDAFIAEIGGLNDQFFDAMSSQASDPDYYPGASQDSMSVLLAHNNLASLWTLMKEQIRRTFLPTPNDSCIISPSIPAHSQPACLEEYQTILSPLLTAKYLSSTDSDDGVPHELGSRSFLFDPTALTSYVSDEMLWWRGHRAPRGVEVMDAWKCRICEFRDDCEWRKGKERELATRQRRSKKTAMETLGASAR